MQKIIYSFFIILLAACSAAHAQNQTMGIAAVINDEVISQLDISERLALVSMTANLANTPENMQKLTPQILRNLIDERIQLQEAKRLNIVATEGEINNGLARIAEQNKIPPDKLEEAIVKQGGSFDSLLDQIKATIGWTKVIRQRFASTAIITEEEINQEAAVAAANAAAPQYQLAEITLLVESPADEDSVKQLADRLIQQILDGTPFAPLAREFSKSPSAESGGDIGWVKRGQLPAVLEQRLSTMQPNQITKPIRTNDGYVILYLRDTRIPTADSMPPVDRQAIADFLRQKKLESAARKYLRDLRSIALIDIKTPQ